MDWVQKGFREDSTLMDKEENTNIHCMTQNKLIHREEHEKVGTYTTFKPYKRLIDIETN